MAKATAVTGSVICDGKPKFLLPGVGLPDARGLVGAADAQQLAVRREGEAGDPIGVSFEFERRALVSRFHTRTMASVPPVASHLPSARKGDREHFVLGLLDGRDCSGLEIDQRDGAGASGGRHRRPRACDCPCRRRGRVPGRRGLPSLRSSLPVRGVPEEDFLVPAGDEHFAVGRKGEGGNWDLRLGGRKAEGKEEECLHMISVSRLPPGD